MSISSARQELQDSLLQAYAMQNLDASLETKVKSVQSKLHVLLASYSEHRRSPEMCEIGSALEGLNFGDIESQIILSPHEIEDVLTVVIGLRRNGYFADNLHDAVALVARAVFCQ